jgi:hypothetical protein
MMILCGQAMESLIICTSDASHWVKTGLGAGLQTVSAESDGKKRERARFHLDTGGLRYNGIVPRG